jgi:NADH-quinone oxidoreductase subunit N
VNALLATVAQGAPATTGETIPTPSIEWTALLPLLILGVGALLLLTLTSLLRGHLFKGFYATYTSVVAIAAAVAVLPLWARVQGWPKLLWIDLDHPSGTGAFSTVGGAIGVDGFGLFVTVVICGAVLVGALVADAYLRREGMDGAEFYVLMMLSALGGIVMAMANDLIVLFLGLETLSIAVYVLTAMQQRRAQSQEAGLKYFILGGFSSAFLLYGIALIYGGTGSTSLIDIKSFLAANVVLDNGFILMGLALVLVGLGFKVAAVPFHAWSPDVYDGAPTPAVVYMAAAVKAAAFAGIVRVFLLAFGGYAEDWQPIVYALAVLSMVVGSLLAIVQSDVKRMLAYSSINHAGFILVAVEAATSAGVTAVLYYLAAYTFMIAGTFAIVALVAGRGDGRTSLRDYRGLAHVNPVLALVLTVFLLAQAGIPFTSGFFAKFGVIIASVDAGSWPLALVAMITAVVAAFLYLRLVVAMYMSGDEHGVGPVPERVRVPVGAWIGIALCFVVTLGAGIIPTTIEGPASDGQPQVVEVGDPGADQPAVAPGTTPGAGSGG